nr:sigma-70 family RNA polymerase sigma factor [Bacilli bacterium]
MHDQHVVSEAQHHYIKRLAERLIRFRRSASIDVDDLISVAETRWWHYCIKTPGIDDTSIIDTLFRQQIKFAMRDSLRDSSPVKVTRTYQAQLKAYERPFTVEIDHAIDISAGEAHRDAELWMDLTQLIKKLPEREQIVLNLYHIEGFNFSEIAYALDVAVSTVTRMHQHALETLRKNLSITGSPAKKNEKSP